MTSKQDDGVAVTEYEMNETVFVPAGDGEPAQWKPFKELRRAEFDRYVQGDEEVDELHLKRLQRQRDLIDKCKEAGGLPNTPISQWLDEDEMAELIELQMTIEAQQREQDRRQAAIDRDIAAGRFFRLGGQTRTA